MKGITWSPWFLVLIAVALLLSIVAIVSPGPTGPQGLPGSIGVQGLPGPPGNDGKDGIDGARGLQGPQGVQGPGGLQGVQGTQGVPGEIGLPGSPGEIVREVPHLASMAISDHQGKLIGTASRGEEIEVWGADFHHNPELRLYDSEGSWFVLGKANVEWHKFAIVIQIPTGTATGVAELVTMTEDRRATYHTIPIMIRD